MPKVIWLPEALDDVARLYDFLAEKNPQAARNAALCIKTAAQRLEMFPKSGKPMDDDTGRREVFTAFGTGAYVLRYRLNAEGDVVIIRVWHSRELRR
ncbi:MAG: type II toxin-antitoxin system RelE/ParE family toxin [Gammaproteobacteria bacterium]